jgi:threonine dehydrogenase-like Zn-dependent dehydrogenase
MLESTQGRGPDSVIDAVGMEAHGAPVAELMQKTVGRLPKRVGAALAERAGVDRLSVLKAAIAAVRRGGTLSIIGVYGGQANPLPMMDLFDKGVTIRMGQAHVKRWIDDLLPLLGDDDPLGTGDLATHVLRLEDAPHAYEVFQRKQDGAIKVLFRP